VPEGRTKKEGATMSTWIIFFFTLFVGFCIGIFVGVQLSLYQKGNNEKYES